MSISLINFKTIQHVKSFKKHEYVIAFYTIPQGGQEPTLPTNSYHGYWWPGDMRS